MVYFLFGKTLSRLWQICDIIGLFFIVVNGQILKNNLTIWSQLLWAFLKIVLFLFFGPEIAPHQLMHVHQSHGHGELGKHFGETTFEDIL